MSGYLPDTGMTPVHFAAFQKVAQQLNRIIVVRNTNPKSTPWIAKGYPPKPITIKSHTSNKTGKVTAANPQEIQIARTAGFYVIDPDGVARRSPREALPVQFPFGTPEMNEPGQIIHAAQRKALVGDYDLLAVIDPDAKGRNLVLAASGGSPVRDRLSPDVRRVKDAVNALLDQPRVMHGAHDQFDDFPDKGGSTAFFPNGLVYPLKTPQQVRDFYALLGRQTIKGKY